MLHKLTTDIARSYRRVDIEDLNVKGMAQDRRLALSLADAALGEIGRQLEYKAAWYGGQTVRAGRFYASSKLCSACGHKNDTLRRSNRKWICDACGTEHDRDWNAAKNIEAEALRLAGVATSTGQTDVDRW